MLHVKLRVINLIFSSAWTRTLMSNEVLFVQTTLLCWSFSIPDSWKHKQFVQVRVWLLTMTGLKYVTKGEGGDQEYIYTGYKGHVEKTPSIFIKSKTLCYIYFSYRHRNPCKRLFWKTLINTNDIALIKPKLYATNQVQLFTVPSNITLNYVYVD